VGSFKKASASEEDSKIQDKGNSRSKALRGRFGFVLPEKAIIGTNRKEVQKKKRCKRRRLVTRPPLRFPYKSRTSGQINWKDKVAKNTHTGR